ncbi:MAG: 1-deoxy-D-xylulose-5-phosphate reductoisomerase [Chlamydiia bacterium]|nr:1-deoxy-D-xylulose-5-phosphate reductoisomerase [Chlamydiia bacterium]
MKRVAILGSTGSIGCNALEVAEHLSDQIEVTALAAYGNIDLLEEQVRRFSPTLVAVGDKEKALDLQQRLPGVRVLGGMEGLEELAADACSDIVLSAITGTAALKPTLAAIRAKKRIGLANKEVLVSAGDLVMGLVKKYGVELIPVDSEHSAIFQCLRGERTWEVDRLILTASGGPFRTFSKEQLDQVTLDDALKHPTWSMGPKITVDSSTLMNKGLEVIEAYWLFGLPIDKIDVVVHPQSIIHSMVEFRDKSILAQMGLPTMQLPIQYAFTFPERLPSALQPLDFTRCGRLDFEVPDTTQFRCLALAYEAVKAGGSLPCYLNAANEVLVDRFLKRRIGWGDIAVKLESLMERHSVQAPDDLDAILAVDAKARMEAGAV